ncbi:MAG: hypothetical protein AAB460_00840 [Patescibacteria group bacterium]
MNTKKLRSAREYTLIRRHGKTLMVVEGRPRVDSEEPLVTAIGREFEDDTAEISFGNKLFPSNLRGDALSRGVREFLEREKIRIEKEKADATKPRKVVA